MFLSVRQTYHVIPHHLIHGKCFPAQYILNQKGLRTLREVEEAVKVNNVFYISENYRNPRQITAYVKERYPHIEMMEIGLDGRVTEEETPRLFGLQKGDRAAIIVSDECDLNRIYEQLANDWSNVKINNFSENGYIVRDAYNIVPISMAKGLEFEVVVLIEAGLNENQIYVGCTRSLRELQVVKTNT